MLSRNVSSRTFDPAGGPDIQTDVDWLICVGDVGFGRKRGTRDFDLLLWSHKLKNIGPATTEYEKLGQKHIDNLITLLQRPEHLRDVLIIQHGNAVSTRDDWRDNSCCTYDRVLTNA